MKEILQDLSFEEIQNLIAELGEKKFRATQVYKGIMQGKRISDITDISKDLRNKLLSTTDNQELTDLVSLFNLNLKKKEIVRADVLSDL